MPGKIPIDDAKRIATERRCPVVVIFGISESGETFEVTTYGMTRKLCKLAASFGEQFADAIFKGKVAPPESEPENLYGDCAACGWPNKPDGCCSRNECCNSD